MITRIAIIGAGISGITLARALKSKAHVKIFEKSRGVSGRMSTRYATPFCFDHGADSFTVRTEEFQAFLKPYIESGLVTEWNGKVADFELGKKVTQRLWLAPHLVASPNMNSLCKKLAENLDITINTEVAPLSERKADGWHLLDKNGASLGVYDAVISTAPPAQTLRLLGAHLPNNIPLRDAQMQGCYSLMIGFNRPWERQWVAATVKNNPIKKISINSTKPGRNKDVTSIIAYACNNWADAHLDEDITQVQKLLLDQFQQVTGIDCAHMDYISTHRWRYALINEKEKAGYYMETVKGLGCVGDWSCTSRIEECWLSATQLAGRIIESMV